MVVPDSAEDLSYRRLTSRHVDVVTALATKVCADALDDMLNAQGRAAYRDRDRWHRILTTRQVTGAFARNGSLAAIAAIQHSKTSSSSHLSCNFAAHRGVGIGSHLVDMRLAQAIAHRSLVASANVNDCNAASIAMLESRGFVLSGDEADAWSPNRLLTYTRTL